MRVALAGAGVIAAHYAECIAAEPALTFAGATDLRPGRAAALTAGKHVHTQKPVARPIAELAGAIMAGRPHRMSAEHAAHVVDVLKAVGISHRRGGAVEVTSGFPAPQPMDWAALGARAQRADPAGGRRTHRTTRGAAGTPLSR